MPAGAHAGTPWHSMGDTMPKISEQVPIEFRAGFGDSADGKKGERFLMQYVDPRQAHVWRGLQGEGIPAWMGHVWIYQGDELVSVLAPAAGERLPERASSETAIQLRAEVARMEGHRSVLVQQLDLAQGQLKATQEQLAGVQQQLAHERDRYVMETAQLDESLRRLREEHTSQREAILADLKAMRTEAGALREEVVVGVKDARKVLTEVHEHMEDMRGVEFAQAKQIAARRLQLERQCSEDMERYQTLALSPGQQPTGVGEAFIKGLMQQGVFSPDFILAVVNAYKGGAPPGGAA